MPAAKRRWAASPPPRPDPFTERRSARETPLAATSDDAPRWPMLIDCRERQAPFAASGGIGFGMTRGFRLTRQRSGEIANVLRRHVGRKVASFEAARQSRMSSTVRRRGGPIVSRRIQTSCPKGSVSMVGPCRPVSEAPPRRAERRHEVGRHRRANGFVRREALAAPTGRGRAWRERMAHVDSARRDARACCPLTNEDAVCRESRAASLPGLAVLTDAVWLGAVAGAAGGAPT